MRALPLLAVLLACAASAIALDATGGGYSVPSFADGAAAGNASGAGYTATGYSTVIAGYAGANGGGYLATVGMYGVAAPQPGPSAPASGNTGGGGGGGDAWSGTPQEGTRTFVIDNIPAGGSVTVDASQTDGDVLRITLQPEGRCPGVRISIGDAQPPQARDIAYRYLAIRVTGCPGGATIVFSVPRSWLLDHNLTAADVRLMHYHDGSWAELPTTVIDGDAGKALFFAITPSFSVFAITTRVITAEAIAIPIAPSQDGQPPTQPAQAPGITIVEDRTYVNPWLIGVAGVILLGVVIWVYARWDQGKRS